ncbi:unnamed protein product [Adineta steineri]|uniref:Uncharacterized protein n=1 Tax=Adineta steineri TaxID=433720 RepID=A0A814FIE0_9BILA|nr:unnamed protein product [Adineta steineri]
MQPSPLPSTTSGPSSLTSTQANKSPLDINHPTSITIILNNFKSLNSMWNQMIQYAEKLIFQASQALQMSSTNEIGLETERVQCSSEIDLSDLHCSTICENILWKPVACQQCETHFCSMCITKWLGNNPNQCPMRCDNFIQRSCSKFIARQLAKLQIACIYQPNGCNEVISYEALEKHEMICGYQLVKCTGCLLEMLQKDLTEHQSKCASVLMTCEDCKIVCRQNDVLTHHSDRICLREQLRQFQHKSQYEIRQLREQLRQAQYDQTTLLVSRGIIADDNPVKRIDIQSTVETDTLDRNRIVSDNNSHSVLNDQLLCSECRNVIWRPVSCGKCGAIFCKKCRPQNNFFDKITTFFGGQRVQHGRNNCEKFEEIPVPNYITTELDRLRVRCVYAPNGCRVISRYYDLERHEKQCEFEMIPCQLCQLPLSTRPPIMQHTLHACFEQMQRENPAGIQQQFMILLNTIEKTEADNRRLQSTIDDVKTQLNHLNSICVKKTDKNDK